jgi:hypothetical protein
MWMMQRLVRLPPLRETPIVDGCLAIAFPQSQAC